MQEKSDINSEISKRILEVIDYYDITKNEFGKNLGYDRAQTVYDVFRGKSLPGYDFMLRYSLSKFNQTHPVFWLITGFKKEVKKYPQANHETHIVNETLNNGNMDTNVTINRAALAQMREELEHLQKIKEYQAYTIELLESQLNAFVQDSSKAKKDA